MTTASPTQPPAPSAAPTAPSPTSGPPPAAPATSPAAPAPGSPGTPQAAASGTETPAPPPADPAPPARVVPTEYRLTIPDGYDKDDAQAVAALAKEHQWTNEEAQAALDVSHDYAVKERARIRSRLEADPDVGGARLEQAQLSARRVLDRFMKPGTPERTELDALFNKTGMGDQLRVVQLLSRVGTAMSEDGMVQRDVTQTAEADLYQLFYPKSTT